MESRINRTLGAAHGIPLDVPRELAGVPLRDGSVELRGRFSKGRAVEAVATVERLDDEGSHYSVAMVWEDEGCYPSKSVFYVDDSKSPPVVSLRDAKFVLPDGRRGVSFYTERGMAAGFNHPNSADWFTDRVSISYQGVGLSPESFYFYLPSLSEALVPLLPCLARDVMISRLLLEGRASPTPQFAAHASTSLSSHGLGRMVLAFDWSVFAFTCILVLYPALACTWAFGIVRRAQRLDAGSLLRLAYGPGRLAREIFITKAIVSLILAAVVLLPLALGSVMVAVMCGGFPGGLDFSYWLMNRPEIFPVALSWPWHGLSEMLLIHAALVMGCASGTTLSAELLWRRPLLGGALTVVASLCLGAGAVVVMMTEGTGVYDRPASLGVPMTAAAIALYTIGCYLLECWEFTRRLRKIQEAESEQ